MGNSAEENKPDPAAPKPPYKKANMVTVLLQAIINGFAFAGGAAAHMGQLKTPNIKPPYGDHPPGYSFSNGMGPKFNSLESEEDKCAVIFEILFLHAQEGESPDALNKRLVAIAEVWSHPDTLPELKRAFRDAAYNPDSPYGYLARAARQIVRGKAPAVPGSSPGSGYMGHE